MIVRMNQVVPGSCLTTVAAGHYESLGKIPCEPFDFAPSLGVDPVGVQEVGCQLRDQAIARLRRLQGRLHALVLRHIGVGGDEPPCGKRVAANLDRRSVRPHPDEAMGFRVPCGHHPLTNQFLDVARPVVAAFRVEADDVLEAVPPQDFGRQVQHFEKALIVA